MPIAADHQQPKGFRMQRAEFEAGPDRAVVVYPSDGSGTEIDAAAVCSAVAAVHETTMSAVAVSARP
jgi:hypothetical protein